MSYGRTINERDISLTSKQVAVLHMAKKELSLPDDVYRQVLLAYGGADSAKFLKLDGFKRVLEHFKSLGFELKPVETEEGKGHKQSVYRAADTKRPSDPKETKTPAQENMLNHYFNRLGIIEPERRQGFSKKVIKKAWPQTREDAAKLIEGLKAMLARGFVAQGGESE